MRFQKPLSMLFSRATTGTVILLGNSILSFNNDGSAKQSNFNLSVKAWYYGRLSSRMSHQNIEGEGFYSTYYEVLFNEIDDMFDPDNRFVFDKIIIDNQKAIIKEVVKTLDGVYLKAKVSGIQSK